MIQDEMQRVREQISKLILPKIQCSQFCSGNEREDCPMNTESCKVVKNIVAEIMALKCAN